MKNIHLISNASYTKKYLYFNFISISSIRILALILFTTAMQNIMAQTWSSSSSFLSRTEHTATLLPNGKVLVAGGYTNYGYSNTCELFDPSTNTWTSTGAMSTSRYAHNAVLLPNGKVLVAGGYDPYYGYTTSCEIYDPSSGTWSNTGSLIDVHLYTSLTLLANGKVLISGGYDNYYGYSTNCELYDPSTGTWASTGSLSTGRYYHTATLLQNGKVLITGGYDNYYGYTANCEIYDPSSGTWSSTGSMSAARYYHTATLLPNGKVLIAGGYDNYYGYTTSCELYDPSAGTWASTGSMTTGRYLHTSTLLSDGNVLINGGYGNTGYLSNCELYNPSSGTWSSTGSMLDGRYYHTSTLLSNGKVLTIGGYNNSGYTGIWEIYNPTSGTWESNGGLALRRYYHTSTLLQNGKVLVTGGYGPGGYLSSCQIYEPSTDSWTNTGSLSEARYIHTATLLPNGKVLVVGGYTYNGYSSSCELYDPSTGTWSNTGSTSMGRYYHTSTLLPNGKVLLAGGYDYYYNYATSCELYDPSSGTWSSTGSLNTGKYLHTATLLSDGKVLVAGGHDPYNGYTTSCELYNPSSGTWSTTASLNTGRYYHTATKLANGKVMLAGGYDNNYGPTSSCELYDPASSTWSSTGSMSDSRYVHAAELLSNGNVLVGGGYNNNYGYLNSSELYNPASGSWSSTGSMVNAVYLHTFNLLPNGKVLSAGGYSNYYYYNGNGNWELYGSSTSQTPATALNFDGSDDYVSINNTLGNFSGDFTIEMNIRTTEEDAYFLSKRANCGNDNFISMQTVGGKLGFEIDNGGANYVGMAGTTTINDNLWHHIAVTRKSGDIKLYVDGNLEATDYSTADNTSNYTLTLGASVCNGQNVSSIYSGDMDEIRFWSRAVTECELKEHMSCELSGSQTNLIAYYKLNQGYLNTDNTSITTITDDAGSNTGTLENFARTGTTSNFVAGNISGTCSAFTPPTASITPGGTTTFCSGESVILSANTGSGFSWQWQLNGNNIDGATSSSYTATSSGNYAVIVTVNGCSVTSSNTSVTVHPLPSCSITGDATICPSSTANIYSGSASMNFYDWSITGNGSISGGTSSQDVYINAGSNCNQSFTLNVKIRDANGCRSDCEKEVNVIDDTDPTWTNAPQNKELECDGSGNTSDIAAWLAGITGSDNCGSATVTHNYTGLSDLCGATGSATVTFTLTDACGNDITKDATITIKDNTDPTWTNAPSDKTFECDGSGNSSNITSWLNSFSGSDACSGSATVTHNYAGLSDLCGATGSATVTFTLTDACGNDITKDATFTIKDNTDPTWTNAPSDKTFECNGSGNSSDITSWLNSFSGSDACSGSATVTHNYAGLSDLCGATGEATVTFTLTDACGNEITKDATITIKDNTDPTWTNAPSDKTFECDGSGNSSDITSWLNSFSGSDECSGSATVTHNYAGLSDLCGATGEATVTFTLTDACGNEITKDATITIKDNTDPIWTNAPSDKTFECDGSGNSSDITSWLNSFSGSDACSGSATVTHNYTGLSDLCGATGSATVTFTLTDACGNDITKDATISIRDITAPVAKCKSATVTLVNGSATITAGDIDNGSYDECSSTVSISASKTSFDCSNIGSNTVTLTVTDDCGNKSTCDAIVTIKGTIPTVSITQGVQPPFCQGGLVVLSTTVNETVTYLWSNSPYSEDASITVNSSGTYSVTVTNNNGCTASSSTTVVYDVTSLLSSYTIIATDEVELKDKSQVQTGGVGALGCNEGEIEVDGNSKITGSTTFAKAKKIKVNGGSTVTTQYTSKLTLDLPDFQYNPNCDFECKSKNHNHCDSECKDKNHNHCKSSCKEGNHNHCSHKNCKGKNDVTVGSNKSVTLTDDVFGKVAIGKGSTVTFTQPVIYMKELKTSEGVTIKFTEACVVIMVCDEVELKDDNKFNSTEKSVVIYVEDEFKAKKNSTINASIYSLEEIKVEANSNNITYMKGLFIAEKVKSNNVYWNWNTTCGSCTNLNKKSLFAADEAGLIDPTQISVNVYPNPNKGDFGIDIVTNKVGDLKISVIDLLGRTVYSETQVLSGPVFVPISLSNAANGQYVVRAEINGQLFTKMILINKQ